MKEQEEIFKYLEDNEKRIIFVMEELINIKDILSKEQNKKK